MCTVSWLIEPNGYQLFFNRDEQRNRSIALPPQHYECEGTSALMPVDPDGGGSWISVNEQGLALCLLNFYQGQLPDGVLKSRGQLLKSLSTLSSQQDISAKLSAINLHQYAPFTLLAFVRFAFETSAIEISSRGYQWDGVELTKLNICSPMTSSSVEFELVSTARRQRFGQLGNTISSDQLLSYHQSHQFFESNQVEGCNDDHSNHQRLQNGQFIEGHKSVCMHRGDAKTVSFSHIEVNADQVLFSYLDDSPCQHKLSSISALRKASDLTTLPLIPTGFSTNTSDQPPLRPRYKHPY